MGNPCDPLAATNQNNTCIHRAHGVMWGLVAVVAVISAEAEAAASGFVASQPTAVAAVGEPARFSGWFQPWVLAVLLALPLLLLLVYRRRDIQKYLRSQAWKRRARKE